MEKKTLILDASVIVKWYFEEQDSEKATRIRDLYRNYIIEIIVPDLLYYEVVNAIRFNKNITAREKIRIIKNLFKINLETKVLEKQDFIEALTSADKYDTTIYDTIYYILAKKLNGKYITADQDFYNKINDKYVELIKNW